MAQLTIKINGYSYNVGCEDGQEAHLQEMAGQIQARIDSIKALGGNARLMADELHDSAIELATLRARSSAERAANGATENDEKVEAANKRRLARLARKAEDIAAGIDQP